MKLFLILKNPFYFTLRKVSVESLFLQDWSYLYHAAKFTPPVTSLLFRIERNEETNNNPLDSFSGQLGSIFHELFLIFSMCDFIQLVCCNYAKLGGKSVHVSWIKRSVTNVLSSSQGHD